MAKLSDVGERQAIQVLAKIFDRGHPIGLGHDCGVVDWREDYLVITTDVVNPRTYIPPGKPPQQAGWDVTAVHLSDIAAPAGGGAAWTSGRAPGRPSPRWRP